MGRRKPSENTFGDFRGQPMTRIVAGSVAPNARNLERICGHGHPIALSGFVGQFRGVAVIKSPGSRSPEKPLDEFGFSFEQIDKDQPIYGIGEILVEVESQKSAV
jgi:hypothetical protein